jgi:hypothetical protein
MNAWILIIGLYSHMYFVTFDSGTWQQNWNNCAAAAGVVSNFYNLNQPIIQDQVLATCTEK